MTKIEEKYMFRIAKKIAFLEIFQMLQHDHMEEFLT